MNRFLSLIIGILLTVIPLNGFAADATSFDPLPVAVNAQNSGGVPVGTIIQWPVATHPNDPENWLECNGQSITAAAYPELFAVVGTKVPNYKGLFLRGLGNQSNTVPGYAPVTHTSGSLGVIQGSAMPNIFGQSAYSGWVHEGGAPTGLFKLTGWSGNWVKVGGSYQTRLSTARIGLDISNMTPVADESRPANMAVRYLIRAKP